MQKNDFLNKLNNKDYNYILEKVLENKNFTADTKNLLLSMLYKIEISYKDYAKVKRNVKTRNEFLEEIINTINYSFAKIKLADPNSPQGKELAKTEDKFLKEEDIIVVYPTEFALMTAITNQFQTNFYVKDEYKQLEKPIQLLMRNGYIENAKEVIYNFDGWTWNIQDSDDKKLLYGLLYQNIQILLGVYFVEKWKNGGKANRDYINEAKENLMIKYGGENQLSIIEKLEMIFSKILIEEYPEKAQVYLKELKNLKIQLDKFNNTNDYLEDIRNQKRKITKKIKNIDKILLDKNLLQEQYEKANEKLPLEKKIFSVRVFAERLKEKRANLLLEIRAYNRQMEPEIYLRSKEEIQKQVNKYEKIENASIQPETLKEQLIKFQIVFLKALEAYIEKIENKKELTEYIYILRYYKHIKIEKNMHIKDIEELKKSIESFERMLLLKAYNSNVFVKLTDNTLHSVEILSKILNTKIIDLQEISIVPKVVENRINLQIYDGEILETTLKFTKDIKVIEIKENKRAKLFI